MEIRYAQQKDIQGWLNLLRFCSDCFPGLEYDSFRTALTQVISDNSGIVAEEDGKIIGAAAFSRQKNEILFFAVMPGNRRYGVGRGLMTKIYDEYEVGEIITVTTFRNNDRAGRSAVEFYRAMGFCEGKLVYEFGYPCQIMSAVIKK